MMESRSEWERNRYKVFNEKIDSLADHPKYEWLRKYADEAISWNSGDGYYQIKAADFIERIEKMPVEYISGIGWMESISWNGEVIRMRLKVNDTEGFNLTLDLNVNYEDECITVVVSFWSKMTHKREVWEYDAGMFDLALAKYHELEKAYFGSR